MGSVVEAICAAVPAMDILVFVMLRVMEYPLGVHVMWMKELVVLFAMLRFMVPVLATILAMDILVPVIIRVIFITPVLATILAMDIRRALATILAMDIPRDALAIIPVMDIRLAPVMRHVTYIIMQPLWLHG